MARYILFVLILLSNWMLPVLYAQEKAVNAGSEESVVLAGNNAFTLDQIIAKVLDSNLTLQSAKYDVIMTDTELLRFEKRYSTTANLEGGYSYQKTPDSGMSALYGTESYQWSTSASLSRLFPTATSVSAGVREIFSDSNDEGMPMFGIEPSPATHQPQFFVSVRQEILKNAFGYNDRIEKDLKTSSSKLQRAAIIDQLSGLVVSALVDYWTMSVRKSAMENSEIELKSGKDVRDIIARNLRYGLAESYDLNQYNAIVAGAETKYASSIKQYKDSVRKFLRTVNMPPDTQVKGVTELSEKLPVLEADAAIKAAFEKRTDYKNAVIQVENARKELDMNKNNSLPSLTLGADLQTAGQDNDFSSAFADSAKGEYPSLQVNFRLTYPLDDTEQKANVRNSYFKVRQAEYKLNDVKMEVRDDVLSKLESVELQHTVLQKARTARKESELYYQKLLTRFRQGKVNSVTMRLALDSMVQARQQELEALVGFNVALLQFDLAKNEIFERYNVNVEKYLTSISIKE